MNKKIITPVIIIGIVVIIVSMLIAGNNKKIKAPGVVNAPDNTAISVENNNNATIKEFSMTSFTDMVNGEPKPQFSLKEIVVNKGDRVRIKITEISGSHNFNIDEFGVYTETPLNKETVVEFVANKTGDFVYYCSKPGHRQNGHWGTLKVI